MKDWQNAELLQKFLKFPFTKNEQNFESGAETNFMSEVILVCKLGVDDATDTDLLGKKQLIEPTNP